MKDFWQNLPKPITVLAPMDDVTDTVFRQIVAECGRPDVMFTEFTNTDGIFSEGRPSAMRRLEYTPGEQPLVAQIWGNNPENYYKAAKLINEMGFTALDINMGCPVTKLVGRGECSGLISNPTLAIELIQAAQEGAGDMPVSVKTRIGTNRVMVYEWFPILLSQKLDALIVHGRTAKQKSAVPNNWDEIAKVVKLRDQINPRTVLIGNGDLLSLEDIERVHVDYGVDGGMVGRGIFQDPFLFNPDRSINDLSIPERMELLLKHTRMFVEKWEGIRNFPVLKKFYKIYIAGFPGASNLRVELMEAEGLPDVERIVKHYLSNPDALANKLAEEPLH